MKNIESRGIPAAYMTTSLFHRIQNQGFRANGMTNARRVIMDHSLMATAEMYTSQNNRPGRQAMEYLKENVLNTTDYPDRARMEYAGVADLTALEQAEIALTAPLTEEERNPQPLTYYDTMEGFGNDRYIEIKAKSFAEAQQIFDRIAMMDAGSGYGPDLERVGTNDGLGFYGNFGDGLPLVPPTDELVKEMLAGSERGKHPDDVIGWLKFQGGAMTVEKVAINAVMAGAKPEHFPVILSAVELLSSGWDFDKMWYHGLGTGSDSTLHIMVNGPLGAELGISGGEGSNGGAGNRVNNVIGRAIRMCIRNLGHISTEVDDHQYKGREHDHVLIFFREEEEKLPGWDPAKWDGDPRTKDMWVPYHVEMGFRPEESTITIWAGSSTGNTAYGGEPFFWTQARLSGNGSIISGGSGYGGMLDTGAINFVAISPGMAQAMYDYKGVHNKDALRATVTPPSTGGSGQGGLYYTLNPVVAGGDLASVRIYGNYSFYNRMNHQIQLISGATLTENGRAASVYKSAHIGVTGSDTVGTKVADADVTSMFFSAPSVNAPKELSDAYPVGTWPLAAGTYDPALDAFTIQEGAYVFGLFTSSYGTLPAPTAIAGYTKIASAEKMSPGQWCLLKGSSGFDYVIVMDDETEAPENPLDPASEGKESAWLPSAPRNVKVKFSEGSVAGRKNITVTWDAPEDDGNTPIIAYQLAFAHGGAIQSFAITDAPDGKVDLGDADSCNYVAHSYSVYNHTVVPVMEGFGMGVQTSGANRIYTVQAGTDAFEKRSFTFENMPVGYECFIRVRAVNGVRSALELDATESLATSLGASPTFFWFNDGMTARGSGHGAWGLYNGGKSLVIEADAK
jgi:hypothetical protein